LGISSIKIKAASFQDGGAGSQVLEGFGIGEVFLDLDPGMQGFRGIVIEDGNRALDEDGAGIGSAIDDMDRTTSDFCAIFEGLLPGGNAGEGGQERRMDIEDPVGEGGQKSGFYDAHKAGQSDDLRSPGLKGGDLLAFGFALQFRFERGGADEFGRDSVLAGAGEDKGGFDIRNNTDDTGVETAGGDGIDQGLAITAFAGSQNGDGQG